MKKFGLMAAGLLLAQSILSPLAIAKAHQQGSAQTVEEFVVPNQVCANEPFTFAALNVIEGEVVTVKTVDGEVVQAKKADKFGRVFLPAGLAAGAYLLSTGSGKGSSKMNIAPPRNPPGAGHLTVPQMPGCFDVAEGINLNGSGMSGNAADMMLKLGNTEFPVLAATATEMKTGPLPSSACGAGSLLLTNGQTGDSTDLGTVVCYQLSAKLGKQTLVGGEQTVLQFTFVPADFIGVVDVQILSGPVCFEGGAKEMEFRISNGAGNLPLVADPAGQGPFRVAYNIHEILGAGKLDGSTFQARPGGQPGGKPEPAGNEKKKRCPLEKHIRDEANGWTQSERKEKDPATGKERTIYIITRTVRCSIHKSCRKDEGHGGNCVFTGRSRCKDHDIEEKREFATEQERKDSMKDTAIPDDLKYPK